MLKLKLYDCEEDVADFLTAVVGEDVYTLSPNPEYCLGVCMYFGRLTGERKVWDGNKFYDITGVEVDPEKYPEVVKWAEGLSEDR